MGTISINGVLFAPTKKAATETLFHGPVTASGTYRVTKTGITLYNMRGERIGGINRYGVLYRSSRIPGDGRFWHQCANPDGIPEYARYSNRYAECQAALESFGIERW
jgi:hypothetical protein